jgi:hypothetical protein
MSRPNRSVLVPTLVGLALATTVLGGCAMPSRRAPVLTQAQLMMGIIGKDHPVPQAKATQMGCSCHIKAAQDAAAGK